jgi:steroid 5-alpha reductase family enzyme
MTKLSKTASLIVVAIVYIISFAAGVVAFNLLSGTWDILLSFLAADVVATIVVWFAGVIFNNSSMYDPYWSVAPIVLVIAFIILARNISAVSLLYLLLFLFWGVRLTLNWIIGWRGMLHQDWRYTMLHDKNPKLWFLTNFFGINMLPTLFVFAGMIPAYYAIINASDINVITILGAAVCAAAVVLEIVSDAQMRFFKRAAKNSGSNMDSGLWRYSRHPNYFGEVSFWWGVFIIQISVIPGIVWTVFAPVAITLLFVFISIPMMEKRLLKTKQGYAEYKKATSMLMLLPPKR